METKIYTVEEISNFFLQMLINKTDGKISKISNNSVLRGLAFGVSKVNQKGMKDSALIESELFPDYAYGEYLDKIVQRSGVISRQRNRGSSVYVRLVATPGSIYISSSCTFISTSGYNFVLEEDFVIGEYGYGYAKIRSLDIGANTNVPANTITKITGGPSGHKYLTNEVPAEGGMDIEDDQSLLNRLLQNFNSFAFDTLGKLKSICQILNPLVLDIKKIGFDTNNKTILGIVTSNGTALSEQDLDYLLSKARYYLSLTDIPVANGLDSLPNIVLQNISFTLIDIDFRVDLYNNVNPDIFRQNVQRQISQYLDFRRWGHKAQVDWEELYYIVRNQEGVKSVPEQYFFPHQDIEIPSISYPRLRGFVMRNPTGIVIEDLNGVIAPVYYSPDYSQNVYTQINIDYGF